MIDGYVNIAIPPVLDASHSSLRENKQWGMEPFLLLLLYCQKPETICPFSDTMMMLTSPQAGHP